MGMTKRYDLIVSGPRPGLERFLMDPRCLRPYRDWTDPRLDEWWDRLSGGDFAAVGPWPTSLRAYDDEPCHLFFHWGMSYHRSMLRTPYDRWFEALVAAHPDLTFGLTEDYSDVHHGSFTDKYWTASAGHVDWTGWFEGDEADAFLGAHLYPTGWLRARCVGVADHRPETFCSQCRRFIEGSYPDWQTIVAEHGAGLHAPTDPKATHGHHRAPSCRARHGRRMGEVRTCPACLHEHPVPTTCEECPDCQSELTSAADAVFADLLPGGAEASAARARHDERVRLHGRCDMRCGVPFCRGTHVDEDALDRFLHFEEPL